MSSRVELYMRRAAVLAARARGRTFPNPLVGALIVKSGRVIGQGYHRKAGEPHAEILALRQAGDHALGATLYCTLEPCAHFGRTGPCVETIIASGIREVFVGMRDPNPINDGRGIRRLRAAGIRVEEGFLKQELSLLNKPFIHAMKKGRPLVTIKFAASLDGKIATRAGVSKWITGSKARDYAHRCRRNFDAIMVGVNTVVQDDPRLEPHREDRGHSLTKIVVDSQGLLPLNARLLKTHQRVIVATIGRHPAQEKSLQRRGVTVIRTRSDHGRVSLKELLQRLGNEEIRNLLVEGGAQLLGSFIDQKLADEALIFLAPSIIGGSRALSAVGGEGAVTPARAVRVRNATWRAIGPDHVIEGELVYGKRG